MCPIKPNVSECLQNDLLTPGLGCVQCGGLHDY